MTYTYLALGDSYTIGEQVPVFENFPYQTIQLLRKQFLGVHQFHPPEIVAKTGFTTDELNEQISKTVLQSEYDFVSLLIGVNNQYRGRPVDNFAIEFEELLKQAIAFAGGNHKSVFVLGIPDWGATPFADGKDRQKIAGEIDKYNKCCENISNKYECSFIEITYSQREDGLNPDYLAADQLHPSGKEYAKWSILLSKKISEKIISCFP
ncbi:MAG: SGNH/GDSL hydrolase family protein [Ferruginibacter sp.]|nr:SGNH/GDSL hydrolase family protein [Ferruginibacter sp.]